MASNDLKVARKGAARGRAAVAMLAPRAWGGVAGRALPRVIACAVAIGALALASRATAQPTGTLESDARLAADVDVQGVTLAGDTVTGTVVNRSRHEVRDVQLMVTRSWLWRDERHPGPINPGGSYPFKLPSTIPPGGSVRFSFELPPAEAPTDLGHFEVSAAIDGYTEVEYRLP
jgi:hypothetical protein